MDQTAPRSIARRRFLRTAAGTTAGMASWLALGQPQTPAVVVDHNRYVIRIIERLSGALEGGIVEIPFR